MKTTHCEECNIEFRYCPHKRRGRFCSNKCSQDFFYRTKHAPKVEAGKAGPVSIKTYLLRKNPFCSECGLGEIWNNKPITLQLDHKDGNSDNNILSNVRLLCPNCHSQTPNYGSKNKGQRSRRNRYMDKHRKS